MYSQLIHFLAILAFFAYFVATWGYLRAFLRQESEPPLIQTITQSGLVLHLIFLLIVKVHSHLGPNSVNLVAGGSLLSITSFLFVAMFCLLRSQVKREQSAGLGAIVLPLAGGMFFYSAILYHYGTPSMGLVYDTSLIVHLFGVVFGVVVLGFSCCFGVALIVQNSLLRHYPAWGLVSRMPALSTLDSWNTKAIALGLLFLVVSICFGFLGAIDQGVMQANRSAKLGASGMLLIMYFGLLFARFRWGWRGRRFALLSILAFSSLLLTFWAVTWFD